jgi:hypothetical protein
MSEEERYKLAWRDRTRRATLGVTVFFGGAAALPGVGSRLVHQKAKSPCSGAPVADCLSVPAQRQKWRPNSFPGHIETLEQIGLLS